MDFYLDFMRTLERSPDPEAALRELTKAIKEVVKQAPVRVALAEGAALLAVIHDYSNPKAIRTLPAFRDLMESMELLLTALDADLDLEEHLWDEESECSSSSRRIDGLDSESEGLSQFFLDFEHIESWGKARWAVFTAQLDMAIDIAATSPMGLDSMSRLLSDIRRSFDRIPMEAQEQALVAADKLVQAIRKNMERLMDTLQDKRQINLISESMDMDDWDGKNDPPDGFLEEPPDVDESGAFSTSDELRPKLDPSGWRNWSEEDWIIFDQAVADAKTAATAEPSDTAPAMHLFLGIRQNIERLELHRRFSMGNTADDLMEAIKKGMAQDLFQIQKKCPYSPRPIPIMSSESQSRDAVQLPPEYTAAPTPDGSDRGWKRGRVGRELVELNFDHLGEWSLSQWAAFKIHADKMTAAVEMTTDALGQPGQLLEDIRVHVQQIPPHYKEDASQIASQLVQAISGRISESLAEILRHCGQSDAEAGGAIILSFSCDGEGSTGWKISDMYIPKLSMPASPFLASLPQELLNRIQEDTPKTEQDLETLIRHHLDSAEFYKSQVQKISSDSRNHKVSFLIFVTEQVK